MSELALRGENLSFRYSPRSSWVLQGVDFEVRRGEIVGLSGASGRGKTTLARLLTGYLLPTVGRVTVDGHSLPGRGYCPVQLVFQHPELAVNPRWRIADVLAEGNVPAPNLMEALGIDRGWLTRWPHELSGGELQRIAVARVLGPQTRYLVADEMTTMLDAVTQAQLWHVVLNHARRHRLGLLVISHDAPLLERVCDRVVDIEALNRSGECQV